MKNRRSDAANFVAKFAMANKVVLALAALDVLFVTFFPIQNNDVWWQLAAGREICRSHRLLSTDTFSCTIPGNPWLNKYALFEILTYLLFSKGGANALIALRSLLVLLSIFLIFLPVRSWRKQKATPSVHPLLMAVLIVITGILLAPRMFVRPELFSLVCFSAAILLWERQRHKKINAGFLAGIIGLQILWANLHSAFVLGFIIAAVYVMERLWGLRSVSVEGGKFGVGEKCIGVRELVLLPILALASGVNPFGYRLFAGVMDVMRTPFHHRLLLEWQPIFYKDYVSPFRWIIVAVGAMTFFGFFLIRLRRRRRLRPAHLALGIFFFIMTVKSRRHVGYFALTLAVINLWNYSSAMAFFRERFGGRRWISLVVGLFLLVLLIAFSKTLTSGAFFSVLGVNRPFGFGVQKSRYPWYCAEFMESAGVSGNLFNGYDVGGFLLYRLTPKVRPCIDGRAEPFPPTLVERHWRIIVGDESPEPFLEKYQVTLALIDYDDRHLLRHFRQDSCWVLCYVGYKSALFLKRTEKNASIIARFEIPDKRPLADAQLNRLLLPPPAELAPMLPYTHYANMIKRRIRMLRDLNLVDAAQIQYNDFLKITKKGESLK